MGCGARARAALAAALLLAAAAPALAQLEEPGGATEDARRLEDAKKPWIRLAAQDAEKIRGIYLVSAIPQDDVTKRTERYIRTQVNYVRAPTGGGLIGALIGAAIADAIINNQIQSRIERATLAMPVIMDQLKEFDFREEFWQRLGARLENETRFEVADEQYLSAERGHLDVPEQVGRIPVDAVLDLETSYYLSADLRVLVVRLSAALQSRDLSRTYHRAIYAYDTPPVSQEGYETAARAWAANEGAAFRAALLEGADYVLHMLYGDLLGKDGFAAAGAEEFRLADLGRNGSSRVIGRVVERTGERFVVRLENGNLFSSARGERFAIPDEGSLVLAGPRAPGPGSMPTAAAATPATLDDLKDLLPAAKK
jgi:hypothetical protein